MARTVGVRVWFDWDFNGTFTDESAYLVRCSGEARFAPPRESVAAGQGIVDRCEIELWNSGGRFSALNTAGPLYGSLQHGGAYHVPVRVDATIDGSTYTRIFTGVTKIPQETGRRWNGVPTVAFECRSLDELILQRRMSTSQSGLVTRHESGFTEAQIIDAFLTAAGVTGQQIDPGLIPIPWSYLDDESVLEECWRIAAAAGGRLYWDANGVPRYENLAHWLDAPHTTSQQTYTPDDWQRLSASYDDRELFDSVTVEYAGRQVEGDSVLWEPDAEVVVQAGQTIPVVAQFQYPSYSTPVVTWRAHTRGGTDLTSSVTLGAVFYAQRAHLTITNSHASLSVRISPLTISGRALVGGPTADVVKTSAADGTNAAYFSTRATTRNRSVRGNFYIQSRAQADFLAQFLLDRHERPMLLYELAGCLGTPTRRPGDRITINDGSVMSAARAAIIIAVAWRYGGQAFVQDITAIDAAALYPYATTSPGYFRIGTNRLGSADALRGRVFY